ncbi:hypothetical protein [Arthrobacter sp. AG258]|nr:hypothetical protein [Arthrobacter sp. AG258]
MRADSHCIHGDTPGGVELAASVRRGLEDAGMEITRRLPDFRAVCGPPG